MAVSGETKLREESNVELGTPAKLERIHDKDEMIDTMHGQRVPYNSVEVALQ